MKVPIFDTDVTFIGKNVFFVSTAYSKIRKYDIRNKNKPILDFEFTLEKTPINRILMDHQNNIIIGNNKGNVYILDQINLLK